MNMKTKTAVIISMLVLIFSLTACKQDTDKPLPKASETSNTSILDTADKKVEDAAKAVSEAVDEASKKVEEKVASTVKEVNTEVNEAVEEVETKMDETASEAEEALNKNIDEASKKLDTVLGFGEK